MSSNLPIARFMDPDAQQPLPEVLSVDEFSLSLNLLESGSRARWSAPSQLAQWAGCAGSPSTQDFGGMIEGDQKSATGSVQALSGERRASNASAISFTLALCGGLTYGALFLLPTSASLGDIRRIVLATAFANGVAFLICRKGYTVAGTLLMIASSLAQHVVVAMNPKATMVAPFFASIFVMIAATCIKPGWLGPVFLLGAAAVLAEWFVGRSIGYSFEELQGAYIAAAVLLQITTVVAWLHQAGIERAFSLAALREKEKEQLYSQLEKSSRMEALGRLAGGIAHDFNNFLLVIQGSAELAAESLADRPEVQDEVRQIEQAAIRAAALTSQLLAFSRRQLVPPQRIKPREVLEQLKPFLDRLVGSRSALKCEFQETASEVIASPSQLEQVVMNLVANARDAMNGGGTVTLSLNEVHVSETKGELSPGHYLKIQVTDTGSGIPADVMAHLFEPFYSTKAPGRGTGLGLATSFGIAKQLGGTLLAKNLDHGGASFEFFIPVDVSEMEALTLAPTRLKSILTALVIDDDATVRQLVRRVLSAGGTSVMEAADIAASLAAAETCPSLDLIMTDIVLSEENGLDALTRLRDLHPKAKLVVMSSFSPHQELMLELTQMGVSFLAKPFSPSQVTALCEGCAE